MIKNQELEQLIEQRGQLTEALFANPEIGQTIYKILFNLVEQTVPREKRADIEKLAVANSLESMKASLAELITSIAEMSAANVNVEVSSYTTGQVSQMFGVSVTTINNWINTGRIQGVSKTAKGKQSRIPESAVWISSSKERMLIKEIASKYPNKALLQRKPTPVEMQISLLDDILFFEKKYGSCEFKDSLLAKKIENNESMTATEERDAREWQYLLSRVE